MGLEQHEGESLMTILIFGWTKPLRNTSETWNNLLQANILSVVSSKSSTVLPGLSVSIAEVHWLPHDHIN